MTQAQLVQLAGSIVAILALAGFARWLKLGESRIANADDARRFAEEALAGFEGGRALVSGDGSAALVRGRDGSVAILKMHGARLAARRIASLDADPLPEGLSVRTGDARFGAVLVRGVASF